MEKFSDLGLSECSFQTLEKIWKSNHHEAFEGYLADEILLLIVKSKETIINETFSFESKVSAAKFLDTFCESGPQFILQLCIILGNTQWSSMDTIGNIITSSPYSSSTTIKALTLLTSFSSLLLGASSVCKTLPHIKVNHQEDSKIPQYSWRKRLIIFVCLTVGPRLLTLSIFFGSCHLLPGLITFSVFALVYTITFLSFTFVEYKRLKPLMNTNACNQTLVLAFFASIFSPCIVLNPKTRTLLYSSIASTLANLILLLFLYFSPAI